MDKKILVKVEKRYKNFFNELENRRFHFASRIFLWSGDDFAKEKLKQLKKEYAGENESDCESKILDILENSEPHKKALFLEFRQPFFEKYPMLKAYNEILFFHLFCKTVYGIELKPIIEKYVSVEKFLKLRELLKNDPEAVAILSTHAVNFFYTLDFYLDSQDDCVAPDFFLNIAEKNDFYQNKDLSNLKLYLLTHSIIGATAFYSRRIEKNRETYNEILSLAEKEIMENYENIFLDSKFEFLVCAKLLGQSSKLLEKICKEAGGSFDEKNEFFIETGENCGKGRNSFKGAEHRNVLALMALNLEPRKEII